MADISIPGVSNKYGTNDTISKLMEVERIPLTREQNKLESYKDEQSAWRDVNKTMTTLRENVRTLYSFDNPFNIKIASSTQEDAITADPNRNAEIGSFKINVDAIATADRFLSGDIDRAFQVPEGTYSYTVNDKTVSFKWKGGNLSDFVTSLNKRGGNTIKASLIGVSGSKQALLIESLVTGKDNQLIFADSALDLAYNTSMIRQKKSDTTLLASSLNDLKKVSGLANNSVRLSEEQITVPAKSGFEITLPSAITKDSAQEISFSVTLKNNSDLSDDQLVISDPVLPDAGSIQFKDVLIYNDASELGYSPASETNIPSIPVEDYSLIYVKNGNEEIPLQAIATTDTEQNYSIPLSDYPEIKSIIVKNNNSEKTAFITLPTSTNPKLSTGYEPVNPVSTAQDAKIKYEGITMYRSTNRIDDIVPNVTLEITAPTEKTATIKIDPDTDTAKEYIINFVGTYNRLIADINILTQNKPELITELDYLSSEEAETAEARLGMFQSDSALTSSKSSLQRVLSNVYPVEGSTITMLSQLGVSTNASSGTGTYSASKMRGYLEINEKTLDTVLKENMPDIKNLFGFDSDGDLIIDTGIAYLMDKNLQAYVQTGGILANKTNTLDTKIKTTESSISRLETKLEAKEQEYKKKYGSMESTLNNLESQSDSLTNFTNSQNKNN